MNCYLIMGMFSGLTHDQYERIVFLSKLIVVKLHSQYREPVIDIALKKTSGALGQLKWSSFFVQWYLNNLTTSVSIVPALFVN